MAIYASGELDRNRTVKKYLTVQTEGTRSIGRHVDHYNLDMIIALGYRIDSPIAIRFRQWATVRLHELIQKGFALEDERLKEGGNRWNFLPKSKSNENNGDIRLARQP